MGRPRPKREGGPACSRRVKQRATRSVCVQSRSTRQLDRNPKGERASNEVGQWLMKSDGGASLRVGMLVLQLLDFLLRAEVSSIHSTQTPSRRLMGNRYNLRPPL